MATGNENTKGKSGRRAIIVAGMHRSGTSATAGVLSLLGASLPRVGMPAVAGMNDVGFFEPSRIVAVHDELLASAGSSWHDTAPLPEAWFRSPSARAYGQRLKAVYVEEYGESELTVLQDPRVCRFLPLWQEILTSLDVKPLVVIPFRHPAEVVASVARRDGFSSRKSAILWIQHLLLAEHASRGQVRAFMAYDELLADPRTTVLRLGEQLSIDWASLVERDSSRLDAFLAKGHHHNRAFSPGGARPEELGELVAQTYAIFEGVVGATSPDQEKALDEIRASYLRSGELLGPLVRSLERELARVTKELEADKTAIADRDQSLSRAGHAAESQGNDLQNALASAATLSGQVQTLSHTLAERDHEIGRKWAETAALQTQADEAEARARQLEARSSDLEGRLQGALTTVSHLRASTSWRITYPLRALKRFFGQGTNGD